MKKIKRRSFLQKSVVVSNLLSFSNLLWSKNNTPTGLEMSQWRTMIDYARWCPSIHNLQPHRIKITSRTSAELYYDADRKLPFGDPKSIFLRVALGVFVEHLSIAAAAYGKRIEVEKILDEGNNKETKLIHFANLKLINSFYKKEIDRELILKRRTSRIAYKKETVSFATLNKVKIEAQEASHNFKWSSDPEFVDRFLGINQKALFQDLENDDIRNELDRLFRYDQKSAVEKKDGLSARCMAFPGALIRSVFQKHEKWIKVPRKSLLQKTYKSKFKGTQTIGWFSGKFETSEDLIQAGRMLARAWLRITEDSCYIQPFGSLITNKNAYTQINEAISATSIEARIWMIFRIGYSNEPARSERLDLDTILLNNSKL